MTEFNGSYFDGTTSHAYKVRVIFSQRALSISGDGIEESGISLKECRIPPALGKTNRSIFLPNGSRLDTDEIDAIAEIEKALGVNLGMRFVTLLESHWRFVIVSLVGLVLCVWLFISYGIPIIAKEAAGAIPASLTEELSMKSLDFMDKNFFVPTALKEERVEELQEIFQGLVSGKPPEFDFRLKFRRGKSGRMANAFALPSGVVVMTDDLVNMAKSNDELIGILYHEISHVEMRHSMRSVLQDAGVFLLLSALVGDVASITSVASTLPTVLAKTGYSRDFEREADVGAGAYLMKDGIGTKPLREILIRLSSDRSPLADLSFLSTHPGTEERVIELKAMESDGVN